MGGIYTPSYEHSYHGLQNRRSTTHPIALAHVRSSDHLCDRIVSYKSHFHCTKVSYIHKIYCKNLCICIAQYRFRSSECCTNIFFHMKLFRQQYTILISVFQLHEYCVASASAPIMKTPYITCFQSRINYFIHTKHGLQSLVAMIK